MNMSCYWVVFIETSGEHHEVLCADCLRAAIRRKHGHLLRWTMIRSDNWRGCDSCGDILAQPSPSRADANPQP